MATSTTTRQKRPKFTQSEINSQLQQLFLFSSISGGGIGTTTTTTTNSSRTTTSTTSNDHPILATTTTTNNVDDLDQLAPILINISRSRQQESYLRCLSLFVKDKEQEIESLCFTNYQDFVSSVSQLLRIRQGTVSLKHRVVELNKDVSESGDKLLTKKRQLFECRRVGQNIDELINTLQDCLKVLDQSRKIQNLLNDDEQTTTRPKYFSCLRQLEDLQSIHLKPVMNYPFAKEMLTSLPETRSEIKKSVLKSLKTWMFEARESSRSVGKGALENMESRGRKWNSRKRNDQTSTMRLAKINGPVELGVSERYEYDCFNNDKVSIDFKPLYTCIHIYSTLDLLEELQLSYQADRRAQAYLLLSTSSSSSDNNDNASPSMATTTATPEPFSLPALCTLLEEIVGFFLIESHVLKTTNNFRSEQDVESLWEHMCEQIVELVDQSFLKDQQDPEIFLETKFKILTFVQTLQGYGFTVEPLNSLLLTLFSRYCQLLERKFSVDFEQIVLEDDHQPMIVNDLIEFEKVVSVAWLPRDGEWSRLELMKPGFPLSLPFSQTYPLCCIDVRSFTEQYYQFSEGFSQHDRDIDEVLRKALDNLLITQVSQNVQRRLKTVSNLSQLSQILVNLLFFKTACQDLETLLVTLRATQRGGTIHLESLNSFNQTLLQTEDRIVEQISLKIDSFFEEAEYPWITTTTTTNPSSGGDASGYLMDLMDFVTTVMMSVLIQLPEFAKDYVYKGALEYLALLLTSYLTDPENPRMLSDQGLNHFYKDVKWLINHVKNSSSSDSLVEVFSELNQVRPVVSL